jgi:cytochrome d ubiquinol oxidase subunit I
MIGLTLAMYVSLYLVLIVAYIGVLKYMAEKPEEVLALEARDQPYAGAMAATIAKAGGAA